MSAWPSPCIDVCRYRRGGHCIACAMTKPQKKMLKALKRKHRPAFVAMLMRQQQALGGFGGWREAYARRCAKRGLGEAFERLDESAPTGTGGQKSVATLG